jgi:hypothetical protein
MDSMRGNYFRDLFMEADAPEDTAVELDEQIDDDDDDDGMMSVDSMTFDGDESYDDAEYDDDTPEQQSPVVQQTQIDITSFGTDTSDIHNEYNPKEVDRLNTLIASENSAIGEYFTASKETNVDVLRRLYSDIGEEERFHSEQLIFAKSQLTGEKYIPRDPDVRKEYEELLAMGMDEETAMTTAVDRVGLMPRGGAVELSPEEQVEECFRIQEEVDMIESQLYEEALLNTILLSPQMSTLTDRDYAVSVMLEAYMGDERNAEVFLEAVGNAVDMPKKEQGVMENPIRVIVRWIKKLLGLLKNLGHRIAVWATNLRARRKELFAWIKRHGVKALFQKGLSLYFYNDNPANGTPGFDLNPAYQYNTMLIIMCAVIARTANIPYNMPDLTIPTGSNTNAPRFNSIDEGVERLRGVNLYKTKVPTSNDTVAAELAKQIFGYSDTKIESGVTTNPDGTTSKFNESDNIINRMNVLLTNLNTSLKAASNMQEQLANAANQQFAQTQPDMYNKVVNALQVVVKSYNMLINALTSDINTCMKLNNDILAETQRMDEADRSMGAGDLTSGQYAKSVISQKLYPAREAVKKAQAELQKAQESGDDAKINTAQAKLDGRMREVAAIEDEIKRFRADPSIANRKYTMRLPTPQNKSAGTTAKKQAATTAGTTANTPNNAPPKVWYCPKCGTENSITRTRCKKLNCREPRPDAFLFGKNAKKP